MSETVIPQVKLLLSYDILPGMREAYARYMMGELVPAAAEMGLEMDGAWHTAYGNYPTNLASFVTESLETLEVALSGDEWRRLETNLKRYTINYSFKVVRYKGGFQF
jgi:hypothetical protein